MLLLIFLGCFLLNKFMNFSKPPFDQLGNLSVLWSCCEDRSISAMWSDISRFSIHQDGDKCYMFPPVLNSKFWGSFYTPQCEWLANRLLQHGKENSESNLCSDTNRTLNGLLIFLLPNVASFQLPMWLCCPSHWRWGLFPYPMCTELGHGAPLDQ